MNTLQNKRVLMLAGAGLLIGATIYGWTQQLSKHSEAETQLATLNQPAAKDANNTTNGGTLVSVSPNGARKVPPIENAVQPVSRLPEVAVQARRSAGRSDPMMPSSAPAQSAYSQESHGYASPSQNILHVPPPPEQRVPMSYLPEPPTSETYEGKSQKNQPLREAVRLTGLVDGKAIFAIPDDVARAYGIKHTFTLGRGQEYAGIIVETVTDHSVTIRDGRSICTKELANIK